MQTNVLNTVKNTKTVVALGKFDGLHMAHVRLIKECVEIGNNKNYDSCVYLISGTNRTLCNIDYLCRTLKKNGVSKLCEDMLTKEYMSMSPQEFVREILFKKLNCAHVVVGYNYRFGKDRCGDINTLKDECAKYGICVTVVKKVCSIIDGIEVEVSSTNIRKFLSDGNVAAANKMLGRPFFISGLVQQGKSVGNKIGFPTANIYPGDKNNVPLKYGVYATKTTVGAFTHNSVTNVGINPTLENHHNVKVETYIFDFDMDIYGRDITVEFIGYIRPETKFENIDTLKMQLEKDVNKAKKILV